MLELDVLEIFDSESHFCAELIYFIQRCLSNKEFWIYSKCLQKLLRNWWINYKIVHLTKYLIPVIKSVTVWNVSLLAHLFSFAAFSHVTCYKLIPTYLARVMINVKIKLQKNKSDWDCQKWALKVLAHFLPVTDSIPPHQRSTFLSIL